MSENFKRWSLNKVIPGEPIPAPLYLHIEERYVVYRKKGQTIDRITFDRMMLKKFEYFHILEADEKTFEGWKPDAPKAVAPVSVQPGGSAESGRLKASREDANRQIGDIFHSFHAAESVTRILETSTRLVDDLTKTPYAAKSLADLKIFRAEPPITRSTSAFCRSTSPSTWATPTW